MLLLLILKYKYLFIKQLQMRAMRRLLRRVYLSRLSRLSRLPRSHVLHGNAPRGGSASNHILSQRLNECIPSRRLGTRKVLSS